MRPSVTLTRVGASLGAMSTLRTCTEGCPMTAASDSWREGLRHPTGFRRNGAGHHLIQRPPPPTSPGTVSFPDISDSFPPTLVLHSRPGWIRVKVHLDVGVTVEQGRSAAVGRGPSREGYDATTESQRVRATEPDPDGLRGGTGAAGRRAPHGDVAQGPRRSPSLRASSGSPGPILPSVGRAVGPRAGRPSTPTRPR